jgi:hypothetical protein
VLAELVFSVEAEMGKKSPLYAASLSDFALMHKLNGNLDIAMDLYTQVCLMGACYVCIQHVQDICTRYRRSIHARTQWANSIVRM